MPEFGEAIAVQIISDVVIKTSILAFHIISKSLTYVNESGRLHLRLKAQVAIWNAINDKFKDAEIQKRIRPIDSVLFADIMKELNKLLRKYISRNMAPGHEKTDLLTRTSLDELSRKVEDEEIFQRLSRADKESSLKMRLKLKSEVAWAIFKKDRNEQLVSEIEFWGKLLDQFSSWTFPPMFQQAGKEEIVRHVADSTCSLTETNHKVQVMLARADTCLSSTTTLNDGISAPDSVPKVLSITRIKFDNHGYFRPPSPGPGFTLADREAQRETRSELGGAERRQWAGFTEDDGSVSPVIVEFKTRPIPEDFRFNTPKVVTDEIEKLVRTLRSASKNKDAFHVMDCAGWYEATDHFGIVYRPPVMGSNLRCESLGNILLTPAYKELLQRDLENRVNLAKSLAWTLFELHSVDWVHQSFNPDNILIFGEESPGHGIVQFNWSAPYLVGFDSSRSNTGVSGKLNFKAQWTVRLYTHPERQLETWKRFRKIHDIYSLGVVLLEIGRLGSFMEERRNEEFFRATGYQLKELFARMANNLHTFMGRSYRDAVLACLNGQFIDGDDNYLLSGEFRRQVCEKLDQIRIS